MIKTRDRSSADLLKIPIVNDEAYFVIEGWHGEKQPVALILGAMRSIEKIDIEFSDS
ncbi:hypothetical protein MKK69_12065 [Methylobacterium sp. J-026]|uniref:hypothetical protein n=1 Tax=Methylobacterium sp. J-026 TaxID=2836624 RepID=UPI001FBBFF0D|nr:hypothetical protein [Methylobacterium sp. J-026]MCJ2134785.1 hypothetical protein [Methylobacterium sp. J-026]